MSKVDRFCTTCGRERRDSSAFCGSCGARFAEDTTEAPAEPAGPPAAAADVLAYREPVESPPNRRGLAVVLAGVLALLAVCGVALALTNGTDEDDEVRAAVENGFRAWADAEGGDSSACEDAARYITMRGEDVEARCREEVGSTKDSQVTDLKVTDVEIDGETATAKLRFTAKDGGDSESTTVDVRARKVDGNWMLDWSD